MHRRAVSRLPLALALGAALSSSAPATILACSPPIAEPTIAALEPDRVVVLGTTGERGADGGRLFHVERWFNGGVPETPIVIFFREGEPVGDCSYPMAANRRLIIAPEIDGGRLTANLLTLQDDPASDRGRRLLAEAIDRFGPGVRPVPRDPAGPPRESGTDATNASAVGPLAIVAASGAAIAVLLVLLGIAAASRGRDAPG